MCLLLLSLLLPVQGGLGAECKGLGWVVGLLSPLLPLLWVYMGLCLLLPVQGGAGTVGGEL